MSHALSLRALSRKWAALWVSLLAVIALGFGTGTASATEGDRMAVFNFNSGLCMSIPGDSVHIGAAIDQWYCGVYPDQVWNQNYSNSHYLWFYLQPSQNDNLCATYVPGSQAQLTLQYCGVDASKGNYNTQLFYYNTNTYAIQTMQGWAVSVPGARTDYGSPINIFPFGGYPDQGWEFHYGV